MNIAIINQGGNRYLFEVPESIALKEGEKVKCDTKRGVTDGTVWADSVTTDEPTAKLIGKFTGAKFPLKKVVGKMEYQPFEKSTEDKPEPEYYSGKVVCVDNGGSNYFEIGKVYQFVGGVIFGAQGFYSSKYETLEAANARNGVGSKFIEFLGE